MTYQSYEDWLKAHPEYARANDSAFGWTPPVPETTEQKRRRLLEDRIRDLERRVAELEND